jgi:hypothetical protein
MPARPRNRLRHWLAGLLVSGLLASAGPAQAEPKAAAPGGEAIKKAQGLIRQLSQEKAALEAEKTAWAGEKATLEAKVKNLDAAVAQLQSVVFYRAIRRLFIGQCGGHRRSGGEYHPGLRFHQPLGL